MNNPDLISESLEIIFWVDTDPGWKNSDPGWKKFGPGMGKIRIQDGKNLDPGSGMEKNRTRNAKKSDLGSGMQKIGYGMNIPEPQH
jgi:hypothetical protein